jgi:hypothetical protein
MNDGREQDIYRGATIGAPAGLVITFLAIGSLDGIPDEELPARTRSLSSGEGLSNSLPCKVRVVISTRECSGMKRRGRGIARLPQITISYVNHVVPHADLAEAIPMPGKPSVPT